MAVNVILHSFFYVFTGLERVLRCVFEKQQSSQKYVHKTVIFTFTLY